MCGLLLTKYIRNKEPIQLCLVRFLEGMDINKGS